MKATARSLIELFKLLKNRNLWFRYKIRLPKNCILCERWISFKVPLCKSCRKFLYKNYKNNFDRKLNIFNHQCTYLWEWNAKTDFCLQKIIVSLKDGHNFELYKLFMLWLIKKTDLLQKGTSIAAIPSRYRYHPERLIEAIQFYNPSLMQIVLSKKDKKIQKDKTRSERLRTEFNVDFKATKSNQIINKKVVIFDDVLSTGGSFLGATKALKGSQVQGIAVWAYRPALNRGIKKDDNFEELAETINEVNCFKFS